MLGPEDSQLWLARIAASAKSIVYETAGGQISMLVHGDRSEPVRTIRPWEHANLQMIALGRSELGLPWSRVDVFYGRDFLFLENPTGSKSAAAEWDGYVILSDKETSPADSTRQQEAIARQARYGERSNGGGSPTESNVFHFVGPDGGTGENGRRIRDWLWDHVAPKIDSLDGVTLELPRYAVNFAVGDELDIEAYEFPSRAERARPGEVVTVGGEPDGGTSYIYSARRGRFSVRRLAVNVNAPGFPVSITAKLEDWRSD